MSKNRRNNMKTLELKQGDAASILKTFCSNIPEKLSPGQEIFLDTFEKKCLLKISERDGKRIFEVIDYTPDFRCLKQMGFIDYD